MLLARVAAAAVRSRARVVERLEAAAAGREAAGEEEIDEEAEPDRGRGPDDNDGVDNDEVDDGTAPVDTERRFPRELPRAGDITSARRRTDHIRQRTDHMRELARRLPKAEFERDWQALPTEAQRYALDSHYDQWLPEPEVEELAAAATKRQRTNDSFSRTMASYFKERP